MKNRWVVLFAGIVIQTILGGIYAWSVFVPPLTEKYSYSKGQTGFVFGLTIGVFTLAMILAGRLLDKKGPRLTAGIGAVLYIIGNYVVSISGGSYSTLLVGMGVIVGSGIGFGYVCPLATSMKWFPKYKGLVSGVAVAGFGGGAFVLSKIVAALLKNGMEVLEIFKYLAIIPGALLFISAMLLVNPSEEKKKAAKDTDVKLGSIVLSKRFFLLFIGMLSGTFGGLLVIGNLKPMGLAGGISAESATLAIGILSIGNAIGRVTWGFVQDKIGKISIPISLFVLAIGVFPLLITGSSSVSQLNLPSEVAVFPLPITGSSGLFLASALIIGFSFGACFVLYAARVATWWGTDRFGAIYPLVFLSYGISGVVGPTIGGKIFDMTGSYAVAVYICLGLALFSGLLILLTDRSKETA